MAERRGRKPRPIIPYPGGKWYARRHILPHFPIFTREMVSPFLGGGAIELEMVSRGWRVHGSDIYEPLVNLYQRALAAPGALADEVQKLHPMTRDGFRDALAAHRNSEGNALERAARWYALIRSSYSGRIIEYTMGNYSGHRLRFTQDMIERLRTFSAPTLDVVQCDWRVALDRHPDTFAYLDPPYPSIKRRLYDNHREFDHRALRDYLARREGPWALSINDLPEVRELYDGFHVQPLSWLRHIAGGNLGYLEELLITNYESVGSVGLSPSPASVRIAANPIEVAAWA